MASELNVGNIDVTPYKNFSGGIPDDHEPDPIGEFIARGIVAERGADGTRVYSDAHRFARGRIDRITGFSGQEKLTCVQARDFLNDMEASRKPKHDTRRCSSCGKLLAWDFIYDIHPVSVRNPDLCNECKLDVQHDREIELEPVAKSRNVNRSIANFLDLGNIVEGRPLPERRDDNINYTLNMSSSTWIESGDRWFTLNNRYYSLQNDLIMYNDLSQAETVRELQDFENRYIDFASFVSNTWTIITSSNLSSNPYYDSLSDTTYYQITTNRPNQRVLLPATTETTSMVDSLVAEEIVDYNFSPVDGRLLPSDDEYF